MSIMDKPYRLVFLLFFLFNSFLLPQGLLFTTLLFPVFVFYTRERPYSNLYTLFIALLLLFGIFHFTIDFNDVYHRLDSFFYLRSALLLLLNSAFIIASYKYLKLTPAVDELMKMGLYGTFLLFLVALPCLFVPSFLREVFWYTVPISPNLPIIPRLKLLTYEASYFALLFTPVYLFYFWKFLQRNQPQQWFSLLLVILPMLFSFSLGVWLSLFLSWMICLVLYVKRLFQFSRYRNIQLLLIGSGVSFLIALVLFYPENPLFIRFQNIVSGTDTSARGRTYEAFYIAYHIAEMKSIWVGIGPGQIKHIGRDFIVQYYTYTNIPDTIRIPNAMAELLATYGIPGVAIKLVAECYFFFSTQVRRNPFRFSLFCFIFIYQFTGSYIGNVVEYIIWLLVFSSAFTEFEWKNWTKKVVK